MKIVRKKSEQLHSADGTVYDLESLISLYGNDILRTAYLYLNDMSAAEDIFQEVFIKINQSLSTFRNESSIKTWMIRITINMCKDYIKSAYKRRVVPMMDFKEDALVSEGDFDQIIHAEEAKTVKEAVQKLPDHYRDVVLCVFYQEMSMKEAAGVLSIPENTVKTRLLRAKEKLKKSLEGRL